MYAVAMIFQLGISVLSIFVLIKALQWRSVPKARYFFYVAQAACLYAFGYLLEMDTYSLWGAYSAQCVRYLGVSFYAVFLYLFVRDFGNRPLTGRFRRASMFVVPAVVFIAILLWPESTLYYRSLTMYTATEYPYLIVEWGPLFYVHLVYSYGLIGLCAWEVLRHYPRGSRADRQRRWAFLLSLLVPNIVILILDGPGATMPYHAGSALIVLSLFFLGQYILRHLAVDWLPFARETIVENLNDGYVLVDNKGRFMEANQIAMEYFPQMANLSVGDDISQVEHFPVQLARDLKCSEDLCLSQDDNPTYLRASASPILYRDKVISTCIMLYNVTENHILMEKLQVMATRDALTGLYNRAAFFNYAERDFELSRRSGDDLTLLMLDIDYFKRINDTYGHQKGDEVLREVANHLTSRLRRTDVCGRFGGEEFCVLLPATAGWGALRIADDLRQAVEKMAFTAAGNRFSITISIGVAQCGSHHASFDMLLADADAALYQAKTNGHNQVTAHKDMNMVVRSPGTKV